MPATAMLKLRIKSFIRLKNKHFLNFKDKYLLLHMSKTIWTEENIKIGFMRFYVEHDRLPRAHEIDSIAYLPSSRLIQKSLTA